MNSNLKDMTTGSPAKLITLFALPMMLAAMAIGVIISIFQAATQISEQTLAFVPKIIGVFLTLLVSFGFIMSEASDLMIRLYGYMNQMIY